MKLNFLLFLLFIFSFIFPEYCFSQDDENEPITYFQMEPYDDSLFIKIQEEVLIDPPDPKAEIIVDLRDPSNQTVTIKDALYPFLSFTPETRARIITFPFKINLVDDIHFASVFTRVLEQVKLSKILEPPRKNQIISTLHYINPYLQLYGGKRFGIPFKDDLGFSLGLGTPFAHPGETNFAEVNFHLIGFFIGGFTPVKDIFSPRNFKNNIVASTGFQVGYVFPLGNFLEVSYQKVLNETKIKDIYKIYGDSVPTPKIMSGNYLNWEFRYPFRTLGASRANIYFSKYMNEWHFGFDGKEMSIAGSTFDFRYNFLFHSKERKKQHLIEIFVQRIASSWGFSSFALGPSIVLGRNEENKFGITSFFINGRLKIGTSL